MIATSRPRRTDLAMLALPILLIGFTISVSRWAQTEHRQHAIAQITPGAKRALTGLPAVAMPVLITDRFQTALIQAEPPLSAIAAVAPDRPSLLTEAAPGPHRLEATEPPVSAPVALVNASPAVMAAADPGFIPDVQETSAGPSVSLRLPPPRVVPAFDKASPKIAPADAAIEHFSALTGVGRATPSYELEGGVEALTAALSQCRFDPERRRSDLAVTWSRDDPESFGLALAAAARAQIEDFVIYNDRYTRIRYPMGDVHPMYGVCTDVIVRAYRVLGIDLQELVQKTKSGSGDPNIDHRRVDTLRRFFSRFGQSLPVSSFAEDYRPGDIVTYWRPQNRHSRTHIAIVSDRMAPSGKPLIIHNRGWGPQQEDGLFVDQITGHYRFSGINSGNEAAAAPVRRRTSEAVRDHAKLPVLPAQLSIKQ